MIILKSYNEITFCKATTNIPTTIIQLKGNNIQVKASKGDKVAGAGKAADLNVMTGSRLVKR